ncbi:MAG: hypothetical protein AB7V18_00350 [Pyrinomonadaceae bacterium]
MIYRLSALSLLVFLFVPLNGCGGSASEPVFRSVRTLGASNDQFGEPFGIAVRGGDVLVSDGQRGDISVLRPDGSVASIAKLNTPSGMAVTKDGGLVVADSASNTIALIDPSGTVADLTGRVDNTSETAGAAPAFNGPVGVAVGPDASIYVADTYNDRIRIIRVGSDGGPKVETLAGGERGFADGVGRAARFDTPLGLAMWGERLLVADAGNRRIRVVEPDGRVWTLAGNGDGAGSDGFPLQAGFVRPTAIAVSPGGAIYIADGNAIRVVGRRSMPFVETITLPRRGFRDGELRRAQFNRPSGLAFDDKGRLLVADSDNGLVRILDVGEPSAEATGTSPREYTAEEFRALQPARWPYDPPEAKRDIAGTLGEIRGEILGENSQVWFHNGLDIAGGYGETARFIREEKVLDPLSTDNFGTLRELIRMPTIGYIHIRLGRDKDDRSFSDPRFIFSRDPAGKLNDVRVPRGATFRAGEPIGTLNAMNHVHLIAGPAGREMNALASLSLPNVSDAIPPTIQGVSFFDAEGNIIETRNEHPRIKLTGPTRIVVSAFDRMDGNPERRRLGVYRLGYQLLRADGSAAGAIEWTLTFDRNPPPEAVKIVYSRGSRSGATGETIFNYIVTNRLSDAGYAEGWFDASRLDAGEHIVRVYAADLFGNQTYSDIKIEVIRQ